MYYLNILQVSISLLIPVIFFCYIKDNLFYSIILSSNLLISLVVHRPSKKDTIDIYDKIDKYLIFLWILKNLYETLQFIIDVYFYFSFIKMCGLILSFILAYKCYLFDIKRQKYKYRTSEWVINHIGMHLSGILGTFLLVYRIEYNKVIQ